MHVADGESVTIPDTDLLFNGDFNRVGDSLKIVGADGRSYFVQDYFKSDRLQSLVAPDGALLTGDVVAALAGPLAPGQYAQAGAPVAAAQAIGRVAVAEGGAVAIRNGVSVVLNAGDVVLKGDVVQTQAGGKLGIVFTDGTVFNLGANARMVLNEFVYSPSGGNNSSLINLVQGSFSFLAGEVAKSGDMKVTTPVATMGIRGTLVQVDITLNIDPSNSAVEMSVLVEPNGTTGSFNVYNLAGQLIGTVSQSGTVSVVTAASAAIGVINERPMTPAEQLNALQVVAQVVQTQQVAAAMAPLVDPGATPSSTTMTSSGTSITTSTTERSTTTISVTVSQTSTETTVTSVTTNPPPESSTPATVPIVVTATAIAPVLVAALADRSVPEDTAFSFQVPPGSFTDVDSAFLTYTATLSNGAPLPSWLQFDPLTQTFSGNPPLNFDGSIEIRVTVSDGTLTASDTFTLDVTPVNDAPVLVAAIPDRILEAGQNFQIPPGTFADVDGDTLTYTATLADGSPLPDWLTFNPLTQTFSGTVPDTLSLAITVTASDGALTASDTFTLTIEGDNDAPLAVADSNSAAEDAVIAGSVATNDSDPNGDALTYSLNAPVAGLTLNADGSYTFDAGVAQYQSLGVGESQVVVANYTVTDPDGAAATSTLTITVTGTNDAPVVTGPNTGTVVEGQIGVPATGKLVATDPEGDDVQWTVQNGTTPTSANYEFYIDRFTIAGSSGLTFTDNFNIGNAPPSGPGAGYSVFPLPAVGRFIEANGHAILLSGNAGDIFEIGTSTPLIGQFATVNMPDSSVGLSSDEDFTVQGLFSAAFLPDDLREQVGIRLTDSTGPGTGNDTIELLIVKGNNGTVTVQLRNLEASNNSATVLAAVSLGDIGLADQIQLRLTYDADGVIIAEYDLLVDGTVTDTIQVAELPSAGLLFDGEVWTRAGFMAAAPSPTVSYLSGTYGTLSIDSTGQWTYAITHSADVVQALNANDLVTDTFTVLADDGNGGVAQKVITVNVQGSNDAPKIDLKVESIEYFGGQLAIAPGADLKDVDTDVFDGGTLTVSFDDNTFREGDALEISGGSGPITVSSNEVSFNSTVIGTFTGGGNGVDLIIALDEDATLDAVEALIQAIYYTNDTQDPRGGERLVSYTLVDGDGTAFGGHDTGTDTVSIVIPNEDPVLNLGAVSHNEQFTAQDYNGWTETGDDYNGATNSSPLQGDIQLVQDPLNPLGHFVLRLTDIDAEDDPNGDPDFDGDFVEKTFDLSGMTSAELSFNYLRDMIGGPDDVFEVRVSTDGGSTFALLGEIGGGTFLDSEYQSITFDLTPYISPATTIYFFAGDVINGDNDVLYIDNIQVTGETANTEAGYAIGGNPLAIAPGATLTDPDSPHFSGGSLTVSVTDNWQFGDLLTIEPGGDISVAQNNDVLFNGTAIGSFSGGTYLNPLVITFNSEATPEAVQALIRAISFSSSATGQAADDPREVTFTVTDGEGGQDISVATIEVSASDNFIESGDTVQGAVSPSGTVQDADEALNDFWYFDAQLGDLVTITGERLDFNYDMTFWVFRGNLAPDDFDIIETTDPGFIDFADDEIEHPGPFGDPFSQFTAPDTGRYTIIVVNFLSGADDGDGVFPYELTVAIDTPVITWINPGDGDWEANSNWQPGRVPNANDDVLIDTEGVEVSYHTDIAVHSLTLNHGDLINSNDDTLNVTITGDLLFEYGYLAGDAGDITIAGATARNFKLNHGTIETSDGAITITGPIDGNFELVYGSLHAVNGGIAIDVQTSGEFYGYYGNIYSEGADIDLTVEAEAFKFDGEGLIQTVGNADINITLDLLCDFSHGIGGVIQSASDITISGAIGGDFINTGDIVAADAVTISPLIAGHFTVDGYFGSAAIESFNLGVSVGDVGGNFSVNGDEGSGSIIAGDELGVGEADLNIGNIGGQFLITGSEGFAEINVRDDITIGTVGGNFSLNGPQGGYAALLLNGDLEVGDITGSLYLNGDFDGVAIIDSAHGSITFGAIAGEVQVNGNNADGVAKIVAGSEYGAGTENLEFGTIGAGFYVSGINEGFAWVSAEGTLTIGDVMSGTFFVAAHGDGFATIFTGDGTLSIGNVNGDFTVNGDTEGDASIIAGTTGGDANLEIGNIAGDFVVSGLAGFGQFQAAGDITIGSIGTALSGGNFTLDGRGEAEAISDETLVNPTVSGFGGVDVIAGGDVLIGEIFGNFRIDGSGYADLIAPAIDGPAEVAGDGRVQLVASGGLTIAQVYGDFDVIGRGHAEFEVPSFDSSINVNGTGYAAIGVAGDILIGPIGGNFMLNGEGFESPDPEGGEVDGEGLARISSTGGDVVIGGVTGDFSIRKASSEDTAELSAGVGNLTITSVGGNLLNQGTMRAGSVLTVGAVVGTLINDAGADILARSIEIGPSANSYFDNRGIIQITGNGTTDSADISHIWDDFLNTSSANGHVAVDAAALYIHGEVTNNDSIFANALSYIAISGDTDGTGEFEIAGGALQFDAAVDDVTVRFYAGSFDRLILNAPATFDGVLADFGTGDVIDLYNLSYTPIGLSYDSLSGELDIVNGSGPSVTFSFDTGLDPESFVLLEQGDGWRIGYASVMNFDTIPLGAIADGYGASGAFDGFYFNGAETTLYDSGSAPHGMLLDDDDISMSSLGGVEFIVTGFTVGDADGTLPGEDLTGITIVGHNLGEIVWSVDLTLDGNALDVITNEQLPDIPVTGIEIVNNNTGQFGTIDDFYFTVVPSVQGSSAADTLYASHAGSRVIGLEGSDTLYAGDGADTFVFHPDTLGPSTDVINNFDPLEDTIELLHNDIFDIGDLTLTPVNGDADVLVDLGGGQAILVTGVNVAALQNCFTFNSYNANLA